MKASVFSGIEAAIDCQLLDRFLSARIASVYEHAAAVCVKHGIASIKNRWKK